MSGGISAVSIGSLALGAASAAIGAVGAISSAQAQSANANYQAQVARNNALTAGYNAEYATQAGQEKAQETSLRAREQQGAVTTALAANGLDVNSGSPAQDQTTQRETGSLATQQVVDAAALQAYGFRTQSTSFEAQANLDQAEAGQAETAGLFGAAGSLLGGASSVGLHYGILSNLGALSTGLTGDLNAATAAQIGGAGP